MIQTRKPYKKPYKKAYVSKAVKTYITKTLDKQVEDKHISYDLNGIWPSVSTTWVEADIFQPTQGVTGIQRIGRKVRVKAVHIKGIITEGSGETAGDDSYNAVRMILGVYTGATTAPLATSTATINSVIQKNEFSRNYLKYKLFDKYIALNVASNGKVGTGYAPSSRVFEYFKRFKKPMLITFGDDSTIFPDKRIVLSMISNSAVIPNPGFVVGFTSVTYEDA